MEQLIDRSNTPAQRQVQSQGSAIEMLVPSIAKMEKYGKRNRSQTAGITFSLHEN